MFSVDEVLGMVYIPLGNQVPDQLGMGRTVRIVDRRTRHQHVLAYTLP